MGWVVHVADWVGDGSWLFGGGVRVEEKCCEKNVCIPVSGLQASGPTCYIKQIRQISSLQPTTTRLQRVPLFPRQPMQLRVVYT